MLGRFVVVVVALWSALVALPADAFDCAPVEPSTTRSPAYRVVSGQARCEGFFDRKVSQPFVELVSLTRGPLPPAPGASAPALVLRTDVKTAARLVVQPQRSGPYYRVDAALPAGQALSWDPAPMLAATGLRLAELGFLAVVRASGPSAATVTALAPVSLAAQPPGEDARAVAVVRVSVAVSSVAWRSYRLGADAVLATPWAAVPDSQLFAWQRVALPIALPADGKGLRVDVQAVGADDGRALPLLRFAIEGPLDGGP
ncbi:MAG: hypothetical protein Q8K96_13765 [Rubrivivax sp.]|nr:hypothetical protein [Rubrivivax sp.]